ncbi:hypothetical protein AWA2013_32430 (plasmid) [Lactiplantibacillus plantarum]|nr:hypothetical protein AWA2013_32430 [Lactiplantibacillus plantarum]
MQRKNNEGSQTSIRKTLLKKISTKLRQSVQNSLAQELHSESVSSHPVHNDTLVCMLDQFRDK